jgi:hypothetical protein
MMREHATLVMKASRVRRCGVKMLGVAGLTLVCGGVVACGGATRSRSAAQPARVSPAWTAGVHVHGVVDLTAPDRHGVIVAAAAGRLLTLAPSGRVRGFAPAYSAPRGLEPYIVRSSGQAMPGAGCRFAAGVYALRLAHGNGVTWVSPNGSVRRFAALPRAGLENGIAFDLTGRFGHRLLVTASAHGRTTLFAVDCRGRVQVLTRSAPRVEGGLVVAPPRFGRFGGDLIAPDEISGEIYAFAPDGTATLVGRSGVRHGQDVGVESGGFVPRRFTSALVADRFTARNRHPGDDVVLELSAATLATAGVRVGDLLLVGEGGAATVAVSCARVCSVRTVAAGPPEAHVEGHVVFSLHRVASG